MRLTSLATLIGTLWLSGCAETVSPDAGCAGYREAELSRPDNPEVLDDSWLRWVSRDLDARLDGICN